MSTDISPTTAAPRELAGPTEARQRIETLDVLRGLAILGILWVNIQSFAMPSDAYTNPTVYGDLHGANFFTWLFTHLFAEQKFITLFSMLFGVGMVLMSQRREAAGLPQVGVHYRRMFWLLLIGLAHAYLLWYGDILVAYALLGMMVFWLRNLPARVLAIVGLCLYAVPSGLFLMVGGAIAMFGPGAVEEPAFSLLPMERELAVYRGGWLEQMQHRIPMAIYLQTFVFLMLTAWSSGGLMLIGMALFKVGLLRGDAPRRWYVLLLLVALGIGLPVIGVGVLYCFADGWGVLSIYLGSQFNYWAAPLVSLGWVSALVLVMRAGAIRRFITALSAVGRMALTNYLAQTVICTFIFYGHGFGLFGHLERIEQFIIVLTIWVIQLILSPIWLRHFRFGPVEWLWRSLTYMRVQPMRGAGHEWR